MCDIVIFRIKNLLADLHACSTVRLLLRFCLTLVILGRGVGGVLVGCGVQNRDTTYEINTQNIAK